MSPSTYEHLEGDISRHWVVLTPRITLFFPADGDGTPLISFCKPRVISKQVRILCSDLPITLIVQECSKLVITPTPNTKGNKQ